jgi:hypothetical protein
MIDWDDPDEPTGNTAHIAEHDLTSSEVDSALYDENTTFDLSDSSGRPIAFGTTDTGRYIVIVFEVLNVSDPIIIRPITAYDVPEPTD